MNGSEAEKLVDAWFAARGWTVFPFQRAVWNAALAGQSGLLHANTGAGKTYAVWFAALMRAGRAPEPTRPSRGASSGVGSVGWAPEPTLR